MYPDALGTVYRIFLITWPILHLPSQWILVKYAIKYNPYQEAKILQSKKLTSNPSSGTYWWYVVEQVTKFL